MTIPDTLAASILARDGSACVYCTFPAAEGRKLTVDHVIPQGWFATHGFAATVAMDAPANLVTCCAYCNSLKRDMDLAVFALYLRRRFGVDVRPMVRRVRRQLRKPV